MHLCSILLDGEKAVSLISVLGKLVNLFIHTILIPFTNTQSFKCKTRSQNTLLKTGTNLLAMGFGNDFCDKIPKV